MTHIIVVTPTYQRPLIGTLYVQMLARWTDFLIGRQDLGLRLSAVIVGSEGDKSRRLVAAAALGHPNIHYIEHENRPLGKKFNAGVEQAGKMDADYVLIMGDDAFAVPSIFNVYAGAIERGVLYVGCRDLYAWDYQDDYANYWPGYKGQRAGEPIGSGRLIHKSLLEPYAWRPYDDNKNRNLDASMSLRLPPAELHNLALDHLMTTIKGHNPITNLRAGIKEKQEVSTDRFYALFNRF